MSMNLQHESRMQSSHSGQLILLAFGAVFASSTMYLLFSGAGSSETTFGVVALLFVGLGAIYLGKTVTNIKALLSIPVSITLWGLVRFVAVPIWSFIVRDEPVDAEYVHALSVILIGFIAFWIGNLAVKRPNPMSFVPEHTVTPERTSLLALGMMIVGGLLSVLEWKLGLLSYLGDKQARETHAGIMLWLDFGAHLLSGALLISGIEVLGKRSATRTIRFVFYTSLVLMLGVGIISGMKGQVVEPLMLIVVLNILIRGRIPRMTWALIPFVLFAVYPFVTVYRENLNSGYHDQATTVGGLAAALTKSFVDAFQGTSSEKQDLAELNQRDFTDRFNLLPVVRNLIALPDLSVLEGDEKIYLAPIYPFIPRFLWKSKPVLDKGARFSVALGSPSTTSTAITPIGDLYAIGGMPGIVIGMIIYGIGVQLFMNVVAGEMSEKGIFFFIVMSPILGSQESDVVPMIGGIIQLSILYLIVGYIIYGGRLFSFRSAQGVRSKGLTS